MYQHNIINISVCVAVTRGYNQRMSTGLYISLQEYDYMVARGAFDCLHRKIELIRGKIVEMNPAGPVHDDYIEYLMDWSYQSTDRLHIRIRGQSGLNLSGSDSRPEPDLFWVVAKRYLDSHPAEKDTLLVIEVADSSLESDLSIKSTVYAEAAIQEYWVVDVVGRCIHVMREPGNDGRYHVVQIVKSGQTLSPLAQPNAVLVLDDLFAS